MLWIHFFLSLEKKKFWRQASLESKKNKQSKEKESIIKQKRYLRVWKEKKRKEQTKTPNWSAKPWDCFR